MKYSNNFDEIPKITQIDELETFIGKKNKIWLWTAVNKHIPGELIIMPPTGKESGMRNSDINIELGLWNRQTN